MLANIAYMELLWAMFIGYRLAVHAAVKNTV